MACRVPKPICPGQAAQHRFGFGVVQANAIEGKITDRREPESGLDIDDGKSVLAEVCLKGFRIGAAKPLDDDGQFAWIFTCTAGPLKNAARKEGIVPRVDSLVFSFIFGNRPDYPEQWGRGVGKTPGVVADEGLDCRAAKVE